MGGECGVGVAIFKICQFLKTSFPLHSTHHNIPVPYHYTSHSNRSPTTAWSISWRNTTRLPLAPLVKAVFTTKVTVGDEPPSAAPPLRGLPHPPPPPQHPALSRRHCWSSGSGTGSRWRA